MHHGGAAAGTLFSAEATEEACIQLNATNITHEIQCCRRQKVLIVPMTLDTDGWKQGGNMLELTFMTTGDLLLSTLWTCPCDVL